MNRFAQAAFPMLVIFLGLPRAAAAADKGPMAVSLAAPSTTERVVPEALVLRVSGGSEGFEIEVTSMKATRTCPINRVHWAPHGPDPSEILPWQVTSQRFANERSIPVCGHGSTVVILLASPEVSADGTRFTAGTLVVSIKPKK